MRFLVGLFSLFLATQASAATLNFSGQSAAEPSCNTYALGGSLPYAEAGFHYSNNSYATDKLEISTDGGSDFSGLVHETCGTFSVLSMEAVYYDLRTEAPSGVNFGINGFLNGSLVASLAVELPRNLGDSARIDFGSIFSSIDMLEMVLINPAIGEAASCPEDRWAGCNGILVYEMSVVSPVPVPLPAAFPMLLVALGALGFFVRGRMRY